MSDRLRSSELRIAGFGDCMMSGYPHKAGGFFETACRLIERGLSRPVHSTIVSLAGYSAPRAEEYLRSVLAFNPDYVVIQFASSDAQCQPCTVNAFGELECDGFKQSDKDSLTLLDLQFDGRNKPKLIRRR